MNTQERKEIEELKSIVDRLAVELRKFKDSTTEMVTYAKEKVDKKHLPVELEAGILQTLQQSIAECIKKTLVEYHDSPLRALVTEVANRHKDDLRNQIDEAFQYALRSEEFLKGLREQVVHKASRAVFFDSESVIDKVGQQLKQDPLFKSKIMIAIEKVVTEVSNSIKENSNGQDT